MPDNVTAPAIGLVFATDDLAGVHWPYAKLAFGADGAAVAVADSNGARLPVLIGGSLPAFAATPTVNIGTAPTIAVTGALTDTQLRATALPVSGTVTANAGSGTFAVSAASLPLPAGAATAAGVASLVAALGSPFQAGGSIGNTAFAISGTLPAFAATPTFNLGTLNGAATTAAQTTGNTSLASIEGKLAALEGGRAPVAAQKAATTTRAYDYAAGQRVTTVGAAQVRSAAVAATEVLLHPSVRGFVRIGDSAVAATVGAGSIPLAADEKFHLQITSGQFESFIRDSAADGSLSIMPVA